MICLDMYLNGTHAEFVRPYSAMLAPLVRTQTRPVSHAGFSSVCSTSLLWLLDGITSKDFFIDRI